MLRQLCLSAGDSCRGTDHDHPDEKNEKSKLLIRSKAYECLERAETLEQHLWEEGRSRGDTAGGSRAVFSAPDDEESTHQPSASSQQSSLTAARCLDVCVHYDLSGATTDYRHRWHWIARCRNRAASH